jgi:hypothetical protein
VEDQFISEKPFVRAENQDLNSTISSIQERLDQLKNDKDLDPRGIEQLDLESILETLQNTPADEIAQANNIRRECSHIRPKVSQSRCESCPTISFTLGNGLPSWDPNAIPNSDGSYGTFTINAPGNYRLENSPQMEISGASQGNPNSFILIRASNVHLDLCGNTLTGSGNLTAAYSPSPSIPGGIQNDIRVDACRGIRFPFFPPVKDVTICNGKFQYFSINAIFSINASNIKFENLLFENNVTPLRSTAPTGVLRTFLGRNMTCNKLSFVNNKFNVIKIQNANSSSITNTTINGLRGGAIFSNGPDDSWLEDPTFIEYGTYATAILTDTCNNMKLENIMINDVKSLGSVFAIYVASGSNQYGSIVRNCNITDVGTVAEDISVYSGADFNYGYEARGIAIEGYNIGSLVENCTVQKVGIAMQKYFDATTFPVGNSAAGFNIHRGEGVMIRNCQATDIWTSGNITASVVPGNRAGSLLISPNPAVGFFRELDLGNTPGYNATFENCVASNINGGMNAASDMLSPGYGFVVSNVNFPVPQDSPQTDLAMLYKNCAAQDVFGSVESAGFAIVTRVPWPINRPPYMAIYEDCTAQFDRIHNPNGLSNGFLTNNAANNVVWKNCMATGHTLNGFDLSGYAIDDGFLVPPGTGYSKFLLEDCIANANSGHGFKFNHSLNGVEMINCDATNNGEDGIKINGRDLVLRNNISDLNGENGISLESYFPFYVKVATDTDVSNLPIYNHDYTVEYTVDNEGRYYYQYLSLIPNDPSAPLPPYLPINGVQVYNEDLILIKDQNDPKLNGVYQAISYGGAGTNIITNQTFEYPCSVKNWSGFNEGRVFWNDVEGQPPGSMEFSLNIFGDNFYANDYFTNWGNLSGRTVQIDIKVDPSSVQSSDGNFGSIGLFTQNGPDYDFVYQIERTFLPSDGWVTLGPITLSGPLNDVRGFGISLNTGPDQDGSFTIYVDNFIISGSAIRDGTCPAPSIPCWQLVRANPWRAPYTVPRGTKILVAESNAPNLNPGPVMYTLTKYTRIDRNAPKFKVTKHIEADPNQIILEGNKTGLNGRDGIHNEAKEVLMRENTADKNGHKGIHDDSPGGAHRNHNIYVNNHARGNPKGNIDVD